MQALSHDSTPLLEENLAAASCKELAITTLVKLHDSIPGKSSRSSPQNP